MIQVKTFLANNELRNFSYLLYDDQTGASWVIDPYDSDPIIEYIKKKSLRPTGILNTHHHWDHVRGNQALIDAFDIRPDLAPLEIEVISTPGHTMDHKVFLLNKKALFADDRH
jgi:glyoxylase-like metal-dependent hydrolase (beta-lactamase superfamily II)